MTRPVLDLSELEQLSHVVFATDFSLASGGSAFGFLAGTHAIAVFVDNEYEVLNRNLPDLAAQASLRLGTSLGSPVFPLAFTVRAAGSPMGRTGTIKAWW